MKITKYIHYTLVQHFEFNICQLSFYCFWTLNEITIENNSNDLMASNAVVYIVESISQKYFLKHIACKKLLYFWAYPVGGIYNLFQHIRSKCLPKLSSILIDRFLFLLIDLAAVYKHVTEVQIFSWIQSIEIIRMEKSYSTEQAKPSQTKKTRQKVPISAMLYAYNSWPQLEIVSGSAIIGFDGLLSSGMFVSFWLKFKTVKTVHVRLQQIIDEEGEIKLLIICQYIYSKCTIYLKFE